MASTSPNTSTKATTGPTSNATPTTKPASAASKKTKQSQKTDAQHLADLHRIYDVRIGNRLRAERLGAEPFLIDNRDEYAFQPEPCPYSLSARDTPFLYEERYMQYMRFRYEDFSQEGVDLRLHPISQGTRRYVPPVERPMQDIPQARKRKLSSVEPEDPNRPKKKMSLSEYKARSTAGSRAGTPARGSVSGGEDLRKEVLKNVVASKKEDSKHAGHVEAQILPVTPTITVEDVDAPVAVRAEAESTEGDGAEVTTKSDGIPARAHVTVKEADNCSAATKKRSHEEADASDEGSEDVQPASKKQKTLPTSTKETAADSIVPKADRSAEQKPAPASTGEAGSVPSPHLQDGSPALVATKLSQQHESSQPQPERPRSDEKLPSSGAAPSNGADQTLASPVSQTSSGIPASSAYMPPPLAPLPDFEWDLTPPWLTPPGYDSRVAPTTPSSPDTVGPRGGSDSGTSGSSQKSEMFDTWSSDSDRAKKSADVTKPAATAPKQKSLPKPASTAGKPKIEQRKPNSAWLASFAPSSKPPSRPSTAGK